MLVVTGPSGNVGADLAASLVADPAAPPFRLVSRSPDALRAEHGDDVEVARLDYGDRSTWGPALEGVRTMFLLFPLPSPLAARRRLAPFVRAARAAGCEHVVYVSVPGADRQRLVPHHTVEQAVHRSGAALTALRPAYFFQNLHRSISTHGVDVVERDELFVPAGDSRTRFVDSRDVADVARLAVDDPDAHADASYVLAGPESLTFAEVAEALGEHLGRPVRHVSPGFPTFVRRLRRRGVGWDAVGFMLGVYTLARSGRNDVRSDDLERLLGRPPRDVHDWARDAAWRFRERAWT